MVSQKARRVIPLSNTCKTYGALVSLSLIFIFLLFFFFRFVLDLSAFTEEEEEESAFFLASNHSDVPLWNNSSRLPSSTDHLHANGSSAGRNKKPGFEGNGKNGSEPFSTNPTANSSAMHDLESGTRMASTPMTVESREELGPRAPSSDSSLSGNGRENFRTDLSELLDSESDTEAYVNESPKYLIPFLSHFVGAGNQLMEFISAAVIARALNRTLCLTPLYSGPIKHGYSKRDATWGMNIDERYNVSFLRRYVSVMTEDECLKICNASVDGLWNLRGTHPILFRKWNSSSFVTTTTMDRKYGKWKSVRNITKDLGDRKEKCAAISSIFPGLRWQGAYLSLYPFLQTSLPFQRATNHLLSSLHFPPSRYLGVHWRFIEAICKKEEYGLCFARCQNGAIQSQPYLIPNDTEWRNFVKKGCPKRNKRVRFVGVKVQPKSIMNALLQRMTKHNLSHVYLSADANLRGEHACLLFNQVVQGLVDRGFHTAGMVKCPSSPLLPSPPIPDLFSKIETVPANRVSYHTLSVIEQEVLRNCAVFLGSGQSTWSLSVFDYRRMVRMTTLALQNLDFSNTTSNFKDEVENWPHVKVVNPRVDNMIINFLLSFTHAASQTCVNKDNKVIESKRDEMLDYIENTIVGKDGWLEYDACEQRSEYGTQEKCEKGICWT